MATFIGRDVELARLASIPRGALVTLRGTGGVGKTTLAREHAARVRAAGRAVAWADLAPARTLRDVVAAIARALDVALGANDADVGALARAAAAQECLLVADNAEQLDVDARRALAAIAEEAGGATVLVTSREPLHVTPHEIVVEVAPLAEDEAVCLLEALVAPRSASARRETSLAIVRRLDALPLAIELAASRIGLLGAEELLARLDRKLDVLGGARPDRSARHATLRAAIAWSWDLLDDGERGALVACATFEGSFDGALAIEVIGGSEMDALDHLERLRDRSLVHADPPQAGRVKMDAAVGGSFCLLESVRDFVREIARGTEAAEACRARHAKAVLARAEPLAEVLRRGGGDLRGLERLRADLVALADAGGVDGIAAALALAPLLSVTGPLEEADDRLALALSREGSPSMDDVVIARLLVARGDVLRALGRLDDASSVLDRASRMAADAGARSVVADAARVRGSVLRALGRTSEALAAKELALAIHREEGERARVGLTLGEIAAVHQSEGQLTKARTLHAEAIAIHVAEGSRRAEGVERSFLAVATHRGGDPATAIPLHEEALAIHREVRHKRLEGAELLHLGFVEHELGHAAEARARFAEARRVLASAGARGLESLACVLAARLEIDESDEAAALLRLGEAARAIHEARSAWPRVRATRHLVEGHLAMKLGDASRACEAYRAALDTSRDVEVGFEALTPAYLALASSRASAGTDAIARLLGEARSLVEKLENVCIMHSFTVLEAAARGGVAPGVEEAVRRRSSEVRRALAFAGTTRALVVAEGGKRVSLPTGEVIDLSRRKNVRLVLVALAAARRDRPGQVVGPEALLAAGWPGERMRADAATKRLHTAIWTLRSVGLEPFLLTEGDGYLLDPGTELRIS
ncbi:MAG: tetratricopeptide repeat protein [Deltaproteobacteria bacterium]|nr:tetratricopeptide repeat protein [Deltaproteobacteria bacterium]